MAEKLEDMGPVDYLCVEFPAGALTGAGLPMLVSLVQRRIIRVLDMQFVRHGEDGTVSVIDGNEMDQAGLGVFHGAASGMLGGDDLAEAGRVLAPGAAAVLLVYENLWAAPLAKALRVGGAHLVAGGRIPVQALVDAVDGLDASDAADSSAAAAAGRG